MATPGAGDGSVDQTMDAIQMGQYRFGDLLALARRSWVRQVSARAAAAGFTDYRRSDTVLLRILARGERPLGQIGEALGISRQGARKLADGLVARGYAHLAADPADARRRMVRLTDRGIAYHRILADAAEVLNREANRAAPSDLRAADALLRSLLTAEDRRLADIAVPAPGEAR